MINEKEETLKFQDGIDITIRVLTEITDFNIDDFSKEDLRQLKGLDAELNNEN